MVLGCLTAWFAVGAVAVAAPPHVAHGPRHLFTPYETPVDVGGPMRPARLRPFGPSPAPRVILMPTMRVARPSDIPPTKPCKGLGLSFDW